MRLALTWLLLLTTVACAADGGRDGSPTASPSATDKPTPADTPRATRSPTPAPTASDPVAGDRLTGTLGAESIEGGCPYLEDADGTRWEVIYPQGWRVTAEPTELTDPDGEVVARAGDTVTVTGEEARDMGSFCQIGPIFEASRVVTIEPG